VHARRGGKRRGAYRLIGPPRRAHRLRFIRFHGKRHPRELGPNEVTQLINDLAVRRSVSPSTLRIKDIDLATRTLTVRDGKGRKDRVTMLPLTLREAGRAYRHHIHETVVQRAVRSAVLRANLTNP
jgi:integrase